MGTIGEDRVIGNHSQVTKVSIMSEEVEDWTVWIEDRDIGLFTGVTGIMYGLDKKGTEETGMKRVRCSYRTRENGTLQCSTVRETDLVKMRNESITDKKFYS